MMPWDGGQRRERKKTKKVFGVWGSRGLGYGVWGYTVVVYSVTVRADDEMMMNNDSPHASNNNKILLLACFDKMSDGWDVVLGMEDEALHKGRKDGADEGAKAGFFDDGKRAGFMKAFAIGLEIGYSLKVAQNHCPQIPSERQQKRCKVMMEKVESIPLLNADEVDFEQSVLEIRSMYRSLPFPVEPFQIPTSLTPNSTGTRGAVPQTHSW